ncbi:MAG: VTT domain-containing protein [Azoarcus sp.]|nr:VTT domain-containing protein [Azoarcus sp.]
MKGENFVASPRRSEAQPGPPSPTAPVFEAEFERAAHSGTRKLVILIAVAIVLFVLLEFTPAGERVRDWPALYELMAGGDGEAALWFVGVTIALMMVGTPRLLFYALGGFAFGFWVGLALALVASLIASWLVFRIARWGGRGWLRRRFGGHRLFARIVGTRPTALSVALVRCLPLSNLIINLALAMSRVRSRAFVLGTLLGFLPQGVVAVLLGAGIADDVAWEGAVQLAAAALIVLLLFVFAVLRRRSEGAR